MSGSIVVLNVGGCPFVTRRETLQCGFFSGLLQTTEDGEGAELFVDRDPTHFRYATATLRLTYRGKALFCELEVHLDKIAAIGLEPNNQAYEHYNFFRTRLAGTVPEEKLNEMLEQKLVFHEMLCVSAESQAIK